MQGLQLWLISTIKQVQHMNDIFYVNKQKKIIIDFQKYYFSLNDKFIQLKATIREFRLKETNI